MNLQEKKIAIIGLGYVGLPLAIEFGKIYNVVGFDVNKDRIEELNSGKDRTKEADLEGMFYAMKLYNNGHFGLKFTNDIDDIKQCNFYIITVPTPISQFKAPDLKPLLKASEMIGKVLKRGDIVVYESTVYPGCTEEDCVPVLEKFSSLKYNIDFYCGYSPERINPGDKEHTLKKIRKVTSGSTPEIANLINQIYKSIITAGTHLAPSIKVAEAAKVIENSQRDINIAFVNELSKIFNLIGIDTNDVLEAASTKWNFLQFKPGLVGGHCIGVDPYYLAQKAQEVGYHPEIILAGRRINDSMGKYVSTEVVKLMLRKNLKIVGSKVLIFGFTFKENCPDIRNTRVIDIYNELKSYDINVDIYDPWVDSEEVKLEYNISILNGEIVPNIKDYSAVIFAVAHRKFQNIMIKKSDSLVVYDVKSELNKNEVDGRL